MTDNIMMRHFKQTADLKRRQKQEWTQLLKDQEAALMQNNDVAGIAARFAQERDEHNKKFSQEKTELLRQQQKELEELKKLKQYERSNEEMER